MLLSILSLSAGMVLGQRCKVLILAPAILFTLVVAIGSGIAGAESTWRVVLMTATAVTALQIGFLFGLGIRLLLASARASRLRAASFASSMPRRSAR